MKSHNVFLPAQWDPPGNVCQQMHRPEGIYL